MSTKITKKIALLLICVMTVFTVCSCTSGVNVIQEVTNVTNFAANVADIALSISNTEMTEKQRIEQINSLFHEDSGLTIESIYEELKEDERFKSIFPISSYQIGSIPDPQDIIASFTYDEELGGNTYSTTVEVTINGQPFSVEVKLLSNENGMGIADYDIK